MEQLVQYATTFIKNMQKYLDLLVFAKLSLEEYTSN